jgi:serine protease Do
MEEALGLSVEPLTRESASQLGYEGESGVVVSQVENGSPADNAGIQEGDLVKEVNRQPISGIGDYRSVLETVKKGRAILLLIRRGDAMTYLSVKP